MAGDAMEIGETVAFHTNEMIAAGGGAGVYEMTENWGVIEVALSKDVADPPSPVPFVVVVLKEHDEADAGARMVEHLFHVKRVALDADRGIAGRSIGRLAIESAEKLWKGEPIPEDEVYRQMQADAKGEREWGKRGDMVTRMYLRRALEIGGWEDTCRSASVSFMKVER